MDKCFVFEFGSCEIIQLNLELGRKLGKYISSIFFSRDARFGAKCRDQIVSSDKNDAVKS